MYREKLNFTPDKKEDYINIFSLHEGKVPLYSPETGYGFVNKTSGIDPRTVSTDRIIFQKNGCTVKEKEETIHWDNINHYNYGGMVFRMDIREPGAFCLEVTVNSLREETRVAPSGMHGGRLMDKSPWDAAEVLFKKNAARWEGNTWIYEYVTGSNYIEIEVEPLLLTEENPLELILQGSISQGAMPQGLIPQGSVPQNSIPQGIPQSPMQQSLIPEVGISEIIITKLDNRKRGKKDKPTIFTLGDSTVKSYIFEEAGMSGWGQVFDDLFDLNQVNVINYSQGGRSFKSMYWEGRFNEILMEGKEGDYIFLQSGHNDESTGPESGPEARFGRGSTAKTYEAWINQVFIPSIQSRGMNPILITPMTRIDCGGTAEGEILFNGFKYSDTPGIDFPGIMKKAAKDSEVMVLELYEKSIDYIREIGGSAATAMFLSVEAGELPSKTNSGSYANGNPSGSSDGTHFKETLSKQWARIIVTELWEKGVGITAYLKAAVKNAIISGNWEGVYPEIAADIRTGDNSYYRNQIEKLLRLGVLHKDEKGWFRPKEAMDITEFIKAMEKLWNININTASDYAKSPLTREIMGAVFYDAYLLKFGKDKEGRYIKPKYLTDYNGTNLSQENPNFDPNLAGGTAQYYPLTPWSKITDLPHIDEKYYYKLKEAYHLGLIRCEKGIRRGEMINGRELEPKNIVTREKAAKALYFMWILPKDIKEENDK